eukprot:gene2295-498_t
MSIHAAPRLRGRHDDWGKVGKSMVGGGGGKPFLTGAKPETSSAPVRVPIQPSRTLPQDKKQDDKAQDSGQEGGQEAQEEKIQRQIPAAADAAAGAWLSGFPRCNYARANGPEAVSAVAWYQTAGKDYGQTSNGRAFEYNKRPQFGRNGAFSAVQTSAGNFSTLSFPTPHLVETPSMAEVTFFEQIDLLPAATKIKPWRMGLDCLFLPVMQATVAKQCSSWPLAVPSGECLCAFPESPSNMYA